MGTLQTASYMGATTNELTNRQSLGDKAAAGASQKSMFGHRGTIVLDDDALTLKGWNGNDDLTLSREDITGLKREFTDLYGRFIGGLLNSGKPLILQTSKVGEIYLLIDRKEFMETTDNKNWQAHLAEWLGRSLV